MAGESRGSPVDIKEKLLEDGKSFAFFQAIRLLRFYLAEDKRFRKGQDSIREAIRIRPKLSLAHPPVEIDEINEIPLEQPIYRITANFLGIYGESTPLPSFYTEDLLDEEREGESAARDFLDIINYPLYLIFYRIWEKHRPFLRVVDERDPRYLDILYSLMGMGVKDMREGVKGIYHLLKYIGILSQFPKSALGLKTLLRDVIGEPTVDIIPNIKRRVRIPEDQRCFLGVSGNRLGRECYLGETIEDLTKKFRIKIGPIDAQGFRQLLPGTYKYKRLALFAKFYLIDPFEMDLELVLGGGEAQSSRLGEHFWSQLGVDTWLFSGKCDEPFRVVFGLQ
jgi:type VI secretion system protein ImpH